MLLNRGKETIQSSKEAAIFLKKRAAIEEEYAKAMMKLAQSSSKSEGKGGSHANAWGRFCKLHHRIAEQRMNFATSISELAENIQVLQRNTERSRKQLKDTGARQFKEALDSESALEKSRAKLEICSEEWERAQAHESGGSASLVKSPSKNTFAAFTSNFRENLKLSVNRSEEDARQRAASANEAYKFQLQQTNTTRQNYYKIHLPRVIRGLKETIDDCDQGLQKYFQKYVHCVETAMMTEGTTISPLDQNSEPGLNAIVNSIQIQTDFHDYVRGMLSNRKQVDKSDIKFIDYGVTRKVSEKPTPIKASAFSSPTLPAPPHLNSPVEPTKPSQPTFGVDLTTLMENDPDENPVPTVVNRLIEYIEKSGVQQQGLYRVSGSGAQMAKLRNALDRDPHALIDPFINEVHCATGLLKQFFRELPDPLFPRTMYRQLIEAARIEDDRMRLIQIHELVNSLPDANYATLKDLSAHLARWL